MAVATKAGFLKGMLAFLITVVFIMLLSRKDYDFYIFVHRAL